MREDGRRPRVGKLVDSPRNRSSGSGVVIWIPWLVAPMFALMPIGGCALANNYRTAVAAATGPATGPAIVPVAAVVTAGWN